MIRLRLLGGLGLLACLFLFARPASAQGVRIFATASGAYLFNERTFAIGGDTFLSNYAAGGKFTFGGEYMRSKILGTELAYSMGRNNLRITDLNNVPLEEFGFGIRLQRVNANLVIHSPIEVGNLRPYVTAGVEFTRFNPTDSAKALALSGGFADQMATIEGSNKFGFNIGGGVEWNLISVVSVRADVRNHTTGTPTFGLPSSSTTGAFFPVSGSAHNLEFSLGLSLHFGKKKKFGG